ncbi:hypothetical protein [Paenibacillus sp. SI8]|uniref:hypothetical protein n=1 Tax=unclassified Paenibacillus TaxID=185978 RepID=UPI0034666C9F
MDERRDLTVDLALCDAAFTDCGNCNIVGVEGDDYFQYAVDVATDYGMEPVAYTRIEIYARFIAEARTGWPHAVRRAVAAEAEVKRLNGLIREYVGADYKYFFVHEDHETYLKYRAAENALVDHAEDLRDSEGLRFCDECGEEYVKESSVYQDCCKSCADKQDMIDNGWEDSEED